MSSVLPSWKRSHVQCVLVRQEDYFGSLAPPKLSADVHFPDLGTEGKNVRRMSGFVVDLTSSSGKR